MKSHNNRCLAPDSKRIPSEHVSSFIITPASSICADREMYTRNKAIDGKNNDGIQNNEVTHSEMSEVR